MELLEMPYYRFQAIYHYVSVKSVEDANKADNQMSELEEMIEDEMS